MSDLGHGLPNKLPDDHDYNLPDEYRYNLPDVSAMPDLTKVGFDRNRDAIADNYLDVTKKVQGGELCLHHVGFCGLAGLLKPWIAALQRDPNARQDDEKEKKHLVIILDSCYSGIIAEDLKELNGKSGPWKENGCTVTIQTACGTCILYTIPSPRVRTKFRLPYRA